MSLDVLQVTGDRSERAEGREYRRTPMLVLDGTRRYPSTPRLHDNASTLPCGGALGCRLSLKTTILKKPKSYVVER